MTNVLYDSLPKVWNEYTLNTWFQIGIQVYVIFDDDTLSDFEKDDLIIFLLFGEEDGSIRRHPAGNELGECIDWFLNGWSHDNPAKRINRQKVLDFYVDQWRIYADFRQIYGVNLNDADMHWWEFCGMLWNMPHKLSSFLQVIEMRQKVIGKNMGKEERKYIMEAQEVYALKQPGRENRFTKKEEAKIDSFDQMMKERKGK